jgi:hypothetical protein
MGLLNNAVNIKDYTVTNGGLSDELQSILQEATVA